MNNAAEPIVSVVVPVYNAMPYLVTCLASVMEQTIGRERVEMVAVDDGSTDGSGAQLDLVAACWDGLRVVHQERSGGPSRPRNTGLDLATGRYVLFLDADDYLGTEALERMLALAEDNGSDIVVGDRKEVGGRKLHIRVGFQRGGGQDRPLLRSWNSGIVTQGDLLVAAGSDCKHLYRRERIERLGARFPEGVNFGEDSVFATACLEGANVSIVRDYRCYYERLRPDGSNLTTSLVGSEAHLDVLENAWRLRNDHHPRWRRDLLPRDVALDLTRLVFDEGFAERDARTRRRMVKRARALLETWLAPWTTAGLEALDRLKLELIGRGMEPELAEVTRAASQGRRAKDAVIGGRVYGAYPYFRDPAAAVPDECYDVTAELAVRHYLAGLSVDGSRLRMNGHAYIEHVDSVAMSTAVVLRERARGGEYRVPARQVPAAGLGEDCSGGRYDYGLAGFDVELDLAGIAGAALAPGRWGVFVAVTAQGVSKEAPLGRHRAPSIASPGGGAFGVRFAKDGALMIDVPGEPPRPAREPRATLAG